MNHEEVGRLWNGNAEAWTKLARAGYDIYRDYLNTPAFFKIFPDVTGLSGLDIGNLNGRIDEWLFCSAPEEAKVGLAKFKVPRFTRTISQWLNLLINTGFQLERVEEPCPDDEIIAKCPHMQDAQVVAYYLHIRVRKP